MVPRVYGSPEVRFWPKVHKTDFCWFWTASTWDGYGRFEGTRAHRYSWTLHTGKRVPKGLCVCHSCDVRACVNPKHLFLGTRADNNRDMVRKGRERHPGSPGEENSRAKL